MTYPYVCNISDDHIGRVIIVDFECELEIETMVSGGEVSCTVIDVLIEGRSMFKGDEMSRCLAGRVANLAEIEIQAGGWLWDEVREGEGLEFVGLGAGDPDAFWRAAAE